MATAERVKRAEGSRAASATTAVHTVVFDEDSVRIPAWVVDLESFRRWVHSDEVPEKLRVCFLDGEVWVDMSQEQFYSHNQIKTELTVVLGGLVNAQGLGRYATDGMLLTNIDANLSAGPDGIFISEASLSSDRVRLVKGKKGGYVELEGTPDMVLEVVSDSSAKKDTDTLRDLYWEAGIPEYWLVDARGEEVEFTILRRTAKDYAPARKHGGWLKSAVFGKSFRLTQQTDARGNPKYTLEVR
jgi:Uma2 family endonuclease